MRQDNSFFNNRMAMCLTAVLLLLVCSLDSLAQVDLTGVWNGNDGGLYYIRQLGDTVWWYGEHSSTNPAWSNVATGIITGNTISLNWADVPKGGTTGSGILVLNIESSDQLTATQRTGGFGGFKWTRQATTPAINPTQLSPTPSTLQSSPASILAQPGTGIQLLDHAMSNNINESSSKIITRTYTFSVSDNKAYSWLSLGNIGTSKIVWMWYSPDNNTYSTSSFTIPMPTSGDYWDNYRTYSYIQIAGYNAANLPGNWHVDIYLNDQKLLTEQFTLGTSGLGTPLPGPIASAPITPGAGASTPTIPGTSTPGPTIPGTSGSPASLLGLNANDPTIIEMF